MRSLRPVVVFWLAAVVAGCGGDEDRGQLAAGEIGASAVPQWTAERVVVIGTTDAPDQVLTAVGHAVFGPGSELYLAQPMDGAIRAYGADGRLIRSIGRRGEGPGEFSSLSFVGLRGDTLYATDDGLGRVSFFSLAGQVINTVSWHTAERWGPAWEERRTSLLYLATVPQLFLSDGTALVEVLATPMSSPTGPQREPIFSEGPWQSPFLRVDSRGEVIDTIASVPTDILRFGVEDGEAMQFFWAPFRDNPLGELKGDGSGFVAVDRTVATGAEDVSFGVAALGVEGDTVASVRLPYDPVAVTDEVLARSIQELRTFRGDPPDPSAAERVLRDNGLIPLYLPPVTALSVGQDGSIWLRREAIAADSTLWTVLDATAQVEGAVYLPRGDSVIAARGDMLATVAHDELDVPSVAIYRLHR